MEITKKVSVYELTMGASALLARGSEGFETDEELAAWQDEMNAWMEVSGDKLLACRAVIDRADAEEAWLKSEADKIRDRARRFATVSDRVRDLIMQQMLAHEAVSGEKKVVTSDGSSVSLVRTAAIDVQVADATDLPAQYQRVTIAADKTALKAAHKAGVEVPGVTFVDGVTTSIRFGK